MTDEHIVPRWLIAHLDLPPNDLIAHAVANSKTGELTQKLRVHSTHNFVEGRVCEDCNGGWMNKLESEAKPILVPLIDNQRPVADLTTVERVVVGRWAAKTAYLHSWAGPLKMPVSLEHLAALQGPSGCPLPGVGVFGSQFGFSMKSSYCQTGTWPPWLKPGGLRRVC